MITVANAQILRHNFIVSYGLDFQQKQIEREFIAVITFPRNHTIISGPPNGGIVVQSVQYDEVARAMHCRQYRLCRI